MRHLVRLTIIALLLSACSKNTFSHLEASQLGFEKANATLHQIAEDPDLVNKYHCGDAKEHKLLVCHVPPGALEHAHEICIDISAVSAHINLHIAHSDSSERDTLGSCDGRSPVQDPINDEDGR